MKYKDSLLLMVSVQQLSGTDEKAIESKKITIIENHMNINLSEKK